MKKKGTILSFGELLLRYAPDTNGSWLQAGMMPVHVGGAEANVATAIALWQLPSAYLTALPEDAIGRQLLAYLAGKNIDTSCIRFTNGRMGSYYLPAGRDLQHAGVIYDRAASAFSLLQPGVIDWDKAFENVSWFHLSAIGPAVSETAAATCLEAVQAASAKGITISLDLNYRPLLWKYGKQPVDVMPQLARYCDVLMGNIWSADKMLGIPLPALPVGDIPVRDYASASLDSANKLQDKFPKAGIVANTFRFDYKDTGIRYFSMLQKGSTQYVSKEYTAQNIADRTGSGDCYMAGLIYGFYNGWQAEEIIEFATAAAFQKLFIKGDTTSQTVNDIQHFVRTPL